MFEQNSFFSKGSKGRVQTIEHWRPYCIESFAVLGVFAVFSQLTQYMPLIVIALLWAVLSTITAVGATYQYTIVKQYKQVKFKEGKALARFNKGRCLCFVLAFIVSAVCMLTLILQAPLWSWSDWLMILLAIPLYLGIATVVDGTSGQQLEDDYRASHVFWWSTLLVALSLGVGYAVIAGNVGVQENLSFTETFCSVQQPYEGSGVVLFSEAGAVTRFLNAFTATQVAVVSTLSPELCFVFRVVLQFAPFASIAGILGVCAMPKEALLRAFHTLKKNNVKHAITSLKGGYVAVACALPILLVALCFIANANPGPILDQPLYQAAKSTVREEMLLVACEYEGRYYDRKVVKDLVADYQKQLDEVTDDAAPNLTNLINEAFDKRKDNVESFLDTCYQSEGKKYLPSGNGGYSEDELRNIYVKLLNEGVDDTALQEALSDYRTEISSIEPAYESDLAAHELKYVPDWLMEADTEKDTEVFEEIDIRIVTLDSIAANLGDYTGEEALSAAVSKNIFDTLASIPQWIIDQLINRGSDRDKIKEAIEAERQQALNLLFHLQSGTS